MFKRRRLLRDRQIMPTDDHRFAINRPALLSAPSKKSFLQRQRANLCVQRLHVDSGLRYSSAATGTENIGSSTLELGFPRRDLIGVLGIAEHQIAVSPR